MWLLFSAYDVGQPVLCVMDRDIIRTVLIKECYSLFTNRRVGGTSFFLHLAVSHFSVVTAVLQADSNINTE